MCCSLIFHSKKFLFGVNTEPRECVSVLLVGKKVRENERGRQRMEEREDKGESRPCWEEKMPQMLISMLFL